MTSSGEQLEKSWKSETVKHAVGMGKIKRLLGVTAAQHLVATAAAQRRNQAAEDRAARKALWGDTGMGVEEDEMGDIYLGDVDNSKRSQGMGALAAALLGASIPAAGIAGYALSQLATLPPDPPAVVQSAEPGPEPEKTVERDYQLGDIVVEHGGDE